MGIDALRKTIDDGVTEKALLTKQLKETRASVESLKTLQQSQELVHALIQKTAQETQEQLKMHIVDLVQSALDVAFMGSYEFCADIVSKRERTEFNLYLDKDGEKMSPLDSNGGGVVDIISLSLRIAALMLSSNSKVIVMDEPLKFLSANLKPVIADLVSELSHKFGIQFIVVSHDETFISKADKVFTVSQKRRRSIVEAS